MEICFENKNAVIYLQKKVLETKTFLIKIVGDCWGLRIKPVPGASWKLDPLIVTHAVRLPNK